MDTLLEFILLRKESLEMVGSGKLKTFVLITKSESGDDYSYQIQNTVEPTSEEIEKFLLEYGSDVSTDFSGELYCYEHQEMLIEIDTNKAIKL